MPTYNLIEYSDAYSKTSRNLWQYYKDELITKLLIFLLIKIIVLHSNLGQTTGQTGNGGTKDVEIINI